MNKILQTLKTKWIEYLLEILVITIGILGAYALNEWNESRVNRKEEYRILLDLEEEFLKNKDNAAVKLRLNKKCSNGAYQLMKLNGEGQLFENLDYTDSIMAIAMSWGSFDAQIGVTNEIINTGRISLIQDSKLKNRLTGWSSMLINSGEDYQARMDHWELRLTPYLGRYFNLAHIDNYADWDAWDKEYRTSSYKSPFAPNTNLDPLEFENMIYTFKFNNDFIIMDEIAVSAYIDETLVLIEKNLKAKR